MIRDRSLLALLSGELVSRLGSQFTSLALPWFVLVTTHSAGKMSLVFAIELAPIALLGIPSAALVERFGPKRWMVINDAIRAPIVAAVPFLHALGHLSFGADPDARRTSGRVLVRLLRVAAPDPAGGRRRGRAAPRAGERAGGGDDERDEPRSVPCSPAS